MTARHARFLLAIVLLLAAALVACSETSEAFDDENDIVVRNTSERDLWIEVDGILYGEVENNGRGEDVAEDVEDGRHLLRAYRDEDRILFECEVETDFLNDGEDFYWYLKDDGEYTGSKSGDC